MGESVSDNKPKSSGLSRREFLMLGKRAVELSAAAVLGGFFAKLFGKMFEDTAMLARCLTADDKEIRDLWQKELKENYDEALVVVHPGFGLLREPEKFSDKPEYGKYIDTLKEEIDKSQSKGDLIIFLMGAEEVREGLALTGLEPTSSDLAIVTNSSNPVPVACVQTPDNEYFYQRLALPVDINSFLKEKGVKKVKIAGEFEELCVAMEQGFLEGGGFEVEMLEQATYSTSEDVWK